MLQRCRCLRSLWDEMIARPTTILEYKAPAKRLTFQLDWALRRADVARILDTAKQTGKVGAIESRPTCADDLSLVLQKLSQTEPDEAKRRAERATAASAVSLLHQHLHDADDPRRRQLSSPADALFAVARLCTEFPLAEDCKDLPQTCRLLVSHLSEAAPRCHAHDVSAGMLATRILSELGLLTPQSVPAVLEALLKRAAEQPCLMQFAPVDVANCFAAVAQLGLAPTLESHGVAAASMHTIAEHAIRRMAGTFTPLQIATVMQSMAVTGMLHEGLLQVLSERALQPHILQALTGEQSAVICYALGRLGPGDAPVMQVEPGVYSHGRLPATGLNTILPRMADRRSQSYRNAAWEPEHNFISLEEGSTLRESVWSVQQLLHHRVLRSVVADRKPISAQHAAMLLEGNALAGYRHPERSAALEHILHQQVGQGAAPAAAHALPLGTSSMLITPMRGVAAGPDPRLPDWPAAYLRFDSLVPSDEERGMVRQALLSQAAPLYLPHSTRGSPLWSDHRVALFVAGGPPSVAAAPFAVASASAKMGVKQPQADRAKRRRPDPRQRRVGLPEQQGAAEVVPKPEGAAAVVVEESSECLLSDALETIAGMLRRRYGEVVVHTGVSLQRWDSPMVHRADAAFLMAGYGYPLVVCAAAPALCATDVWGAPAHSSASSHAPLLAVAGDSVHLLVVDLAVIRATPPAQRKGVLASLLTQQRLPDFSSPLQGAAKDG